MPPTIIPGLYRRLSLVSTLLIIVYGLSLYYTRWVNGDTLFDLNAVASLTTPLIAWTATGGLVSTRGWRIVRDNGARHDLSPVLLPPLTTLSSLLLVLSFLNPYLLTRDIIWMHLVLVSLQALYHSTLLALLLTRLETGTLGLRVLALVLFVVYPLLVVLGQFGMEASQGRDIVLSRLPLILPYPALVFSPDQGSPVQQGDYSVPTFAVSLLYMLIASSLGLMLLRPRTGRIETSPHSSRGYNGAITLMTTLALVASLTALGIYMHAHTMDKTYPYHPPALMIASETPEALYTIGLVKVTSQVDQSRYPLLLDPNNYTLQLSWFPGETAAGNQGYPTGTCKAYIVRENLWQDLVTLLEGSAQVYEASPTLIETILNKLKTSKPEERACDTVIKNRESGRSYYIVWVAKTPVENRDIKQISNEGTGKVMDGTNHGKREWHTITRYTGMVIVTKMMPPRTLPLVSHPFLALVAAMMLVKI